MIEPITDAGQGEGLTVKGRVRRVPETAPDADTYGLNTVELALNLADALKEGAWAASRLDEAAKKYEAAKVDHQRWVRHAERLHERLNLHRQRISR